MRSTVTCSLVSVIALLISGCDTSDHGSSTPQPQGTEYGDAPPVSAQPSQPGSLPPAGRTTTNLEPGNFEVHVNAGRTSIRANAAPVPDILNELAMQAGFEVLDAGTRSDTVTLDLEAVPVHDAVVTLLKPGPYEIIYTYDDRRDMDTLSRVVTGRSPGTTTTHLPDTAATLPGNAPLPAAGGEELAPEDQALLSLLVDPSTEVRADAAERIEATGIALDYLAQLLTTDPSPEVRIAATYALENSEDPRAVDVLIQGLTNENPDVLVEIIDSLAFFGDRRAVPYLQPLLDHPNEDVREAAEAALETLSPASLAR